MNAQPRERSAVDFLQKKAALDAHNYLEKGGYADDH
jgi:hypothetical protein